MTEDNPTPGDTMDTISGRLLGHPFTILNDPEHRARWEADQVRHAAIDSGFRDAPHHVIVGERQTGKTTVAEQWLMSAPDGVERILVTVSLAAAADIKHRLGLDRNDPRVISFHTLVDPGRSARPDVEYGFDETVRILEQLLRLKQAPHLLTITTAPEWQDPTA